VERNVDPACEKERRDDCPAWLALEAIRDRPRWAGHQWVIAAWDASDDVRQAAMSGVRREPHSVVHAGKWAARAPDAQALDEAELRRHLYAARF
jgi:hypothetical protein